MLFLTWSVHLTMNSDFSIVNTPMSRVLTMNLNCTDLASGDHLPIFAVVNIIVMRDKAHDCLQLLLRENPQEPSSLSKECDKFKICMKTVLQKDHI